jgi:hypothetical protein
MTICLVASLSGVVVAVADTRIRLALDEGRLEIHDGPGDLQLHLPLPHQTIVMPYKYRKIRYLGCGWATVAGEIAIASLVLDELQRVSAASGTEALDHLGAVRGELEDRAHRTTGVSRDQLRLAVVHGAPLGTPNAAWRIGLGDSDARTDILPKPLVANFPGDLPAGLAKSIVALFETEIYAACQASDAAGLVRAAARVVETVAPHSAHVSRRAQIGISVADPSGVHVARYFDGDAVVLSKLASDDFLHASEPAV